MADQPERRAWHLAEASHGPDAEVAQLLEDGAHDSLARGDALTATTSLIRAANLSTDPAEGRRRLAEAAFIGTDITGEFVRSDRLGNGPDLRPANGPGSLYEAVAAAYLSIAQGGDFDAAHRTIMRAINSGDHGWRADNAELIEAMNGWLVICWHAGREDCWLQFFDALDRLTPAAPDLLRLQALACGDTARTGAEAREPLRAIVGQLSDSRDPSRVARISMSTMHLDLIAECRDALWFVIEDGRRGGAIRPYVRSLAVACIDDYYRGRWDEAQELADEGVAVCHADGYEDSMWYFAYIQALLSAVHGAGEDTDQWAKELKLTTIRQGAVGAYRFVSHPESLAAIASADWDSAYRHASELSPAGEFRPFVPQALWVAYDLVEAAMRSGRVGSARAHVRAMEGIGLPSLSPRMALLTAGAIALASADDDFIGAYNAALGLPEADSWPFDQARIQLAFGERLRRDPHSRGARDVLHAALDTFETIGAVPWADRTREELRATRERTLRLPPVAFFGTLTTQELAIVELAAKGLSNKDIASRRFLSPRTVGGHLYRAFPKLGVTSRAALSDALRAPDLNRN